MASKWDMHIGAKREPTAQAGFLGQLDWNPLPRGLLDAITEGSRAGMSVS